MAGVICEQRLPDPDPEEVPKTESASNSGSKTAKQIAEAKAAKNRKKREKKKAAKQRKKGKKALEEAAFQDHEGWRQVTMSRPTPATVRPERGPDRNNALREMGFNRRAREQMETFQRLTRLTGLVDKFPELAEGPNGMGPSISEQLQSIVDTGGQVTEIIRARELCARMCNITHELLAEIEHLLKHPDEAYRHDDVSDLLPFRSKLRELQAELASRAGEPELMKTEAAERMRRKLEQKLLPSLKVQIPQWAEQLRFLHMGVLKWRAPERSQTILDQEAEEARLAQEEAERQRALEEAKLREMEESWVPAEDVNPLPDEEERRVLAAMGWENDDDHDRHAGDYLLPDD